MITKFGRRSFVSWTTGLKERMAEIQMREIKFRQARCGAKGNFVDWFYWGFLDDDSGLHFVAPLQYNVDNYQFTGLCDKNGTEGYGGDKISFGSTRPIFLVKWSICNAGFYLESMDERKEHLVISNLTVGEIIGNIHQPELLEQSNG